MKPYKYWDIVGKEMFVPEELKLNKNGEIIEVVSNRINFSIDNFKIIQPTGLQDINNNEIYNGDIIKIKIVGEHFVYVEVIFKDGSYGIIDTMIGYDNNNGFHTLFIVLQNHKVEIAGNIYETPHLLEENYVH